MFHVDLSAVETSLPGQGAKAREGIGHRPMEPLVTILKRVNPFFASVVRFSLVIVCKKNRCGCHDLASFGKTLLDLVLSSMGQNRMCQYEIKSFVEDTQVKLAVVTEGWLLLLKHTSIQVMFDAVLQNFATRFDAKVILGS